MNEMCRNKKIYVLKIRKGLIPLFLNYNFNDILVTHLPLPFNMLPLKVRFVLIYVLFHIINYQQSKVPNK